MVLTQVLIHQQTKIVYLNVISGIHGQYPIVIEIMSGALTHLE